MSMNSAENRVSQKTRSAIVNQNNIDSVIRDAVFGNNSLKAHSQQLILDSALQLGIFPSSIHDLYAASGKNLYSNLTVPAINIRGITYEVARAVFRAAIRLKVGAFIFEVARSELGYTDQKPAEYACCVLAAAIKEGFQGPIFLQGDHFQFNQNRFRSDKKGETGSIKDLIKEAVNAAFFNIDIDASTLVDIEKPDLEDQQVNNCLLTAEMTKFIRSIEPMGVTISIGGEIGEVGKKNSTIEDLKAFMSGYQSRLSPNIKGISKISVQTGTSHGGVVLPDGSLAQVELDFDTLRDLSKMARDTYHLAGAVQHGASTLSEAAFDMFPKVGCAEIHLATGFQNIIFDSLYFPKELNETIRKHLDKKYNSEKNKDDTEEQFIYKTRKRAFGDFKKELWNLPRDSFRYIGWELENRFVLLFKKLGVANSQDLVKKYIKNPKGNR